MRFDELTDPVPLAERIAPGNEGLRLTWLGQAGFALTTAEHAVVIDPYLSDSLAVKWAGTVYPHHRMHPVPVDPSALHDVDLVLASHRHTDHMDPTTLRELAAASDCVFGVPAAWTTRVTELAGIAANRLIPLTEDHLKTVAGVAVHPVLAAHERIERDSEGRSLFLGFVVDLAGIRIYHSGDCVPFEGQVATLIALDIDVALLPVNGRDELRASRSVPGNFQPEEATALVAAIGAKAMIAHHHGLFDFNTVDQPRLDRARDAMPEEVVFLQPEVGVTYTVSKP